MNTESRHGQPRPTPRDDGRLADEVRLLAGVEDLDEHAVHVVSLDAVPQQRHEHEVVAADVGDTAAEPRAGQPLGHVQDDQQHHQRGAEVQQDPRHPVTTSLPAGRHTHRHRIHDVQSQLQQIASPPTISKKSQSQDGGLSALLLAYSCLTNHSEAASL